MLAVLSQKCYNKGVLQPHLNAFTRDAINIRVSGQPVKEAIVDSCYHDSIYRTTCKCLGGALMATSKMQRALNTALFNHFPGYTIHQNARPYWCIGDEGERLELDFWIVELDVAIEVQGRQHYEYTPHFHGTYTNFQKQQRRDELKHYHCQCYGIMLLEVSDDESFEKAIQTIYGVAGGVYAVKEPDTSKRTPEQWKVSLTTLNERVDWLYKQRRQMPQNHFAIEFAKLHNKIMDVTKAHGMKIFNYVEPEIAQSLFATLQACKVYFKMQKQYKKNEDRGKRRKEANQNNNGGAS